MIKRKGSTDLRKKGETRISQAETSTCKGTEAQQKRAHAVPTSHWGGNLKQTPFDWRLGCVRVYGDGARMDW